MDRDARYRLRHGLSLGRDQEGRWLLRDRGLRRALRLGPGDRQMVSALLRGKGLGFGQLAERLRRSAADTRARLSALARLYLLSGQRSAARLVLQAEGEKFEGHKRQPASEAPLLWLEGQDPPRHACVATGACCSASFLGPMTEADRLRVRGLRLGERSGVDRGELALETMHFAGREHVGMARRGGRCVLQGDDGLCDIHAEHGVAAKPVPCKQFPLRMYRSPRGVHVSLLLACEGYERGREEAAPWPSREAEVRALLREGAVAVPVAVPFEWSAGLPVPERTWWGLRDELLAARRGADGDPRAWLAAAIGRFEAAAGAREAALAEGPDILWRPATAAMAETLRDGAPWLDEGAVSEAREELRRRAEAVAARSPADALRLGRLERGLDAARRGLALRPRGPMRPGPGALVLLADVVANDLQVQVALGHLDAGLLNLARRLLLAEAIACELARDDGRDEVRGRDAALALKVVYRSEPDLTALGACQPRR